MKIVQIVPRFPPSIGGQGRHVYEISRELAKRGNQVTVITTNLVNGGTISPRYSDSCIFKVNRCGTNFKVKFYIISFPLLKELLTIPADIFHAHGYGVFSSDVAALVAKLRNIPLVLTSHSFADPIYPSSKVVWRIYDSLGGRFTAKMASKCIALTQRDANIWHSIGIPLEKIEVVPNGVDLNCYLTPPSPYAIMKEYDLNGKVITFIGRLDEIKCPPLITLMKVFKDLLSDFPKTKMIIIGPDWGYLTKLKESVNSLGIQDSVIFTGEILNQQEKMMFLSASSIGLVLSTQEAFSITSLEFMAFSKPLIASRVGGIPCVVKDGYNGLLVNNNEFSIKTALRKLLSDVSFAQKIGKNGRKLVLSKYNWKLVTDKLERIYAECVGK